MKMNTQGFRNSSPINCSNRVESRYTARALGLVPRIIQAQYSLIPVENISSCAWMESRMSQPQLNESKQLAGCY